MKDVFLGEGDSLQNLDSDEVNTLSGFLENTMLNYVQIAFTKKDGVTSGHVQAFSFSVCTEERIGECTGYLVFRLKETYTKWLNWIKMAVLTGGMQSFGHNEARRDGFNLV